MTHEEIEKEVFKKYPKTDLEKSGCVIEKTLRDLMRKEYREKLKQQNDKSTETSI